MHWLRQVHVINLDRSKARFAKFLERNPHLAPIRIAAVDGASLDRSRLVEEKVILEDCSYLPGTLGSAMSHIGLWRKAVQEGRPVTIFEDDVVCSTGFEHAMIGIVDMLPEDWGIIKWGYIIHPLFIWFDFGFARAKLEFYQRQALETFQVAKYERHVVKIAHSFGLQGYAVSPRGAQVLLDTCLPLRKRTIPFPDTGVVLDDTAIDCPMCMAYASMNAFACMPPLVLPDDEQQGSDREQMDRGSTAC